MALDTYDNLKLEIEAHLDNDDLTAQIDTFIDLAESRHRREVRIRQMLTRAALTVDDRFVALPADFLQAKLLRLLTDPVTVLTELSPFELTRVRQESNGKPAYFTVHAEFEFDVNPDTAYSGEIVYFKAPASLGSGQQQNSLLLQVPELYLYGALIAAEPYLANDERLAVWANLYRDARDAANLAAIAQQRAGPLAPRVVGATP